MKHTFLEAAKRFSKSHIADYVKSREVYAGMASIEASCLPRGLHTEPVAHVERFTAGGKWSKLFNKQVDISANYAFLFEKSLLAECVGERTALTGMVRIVGHGQACRARNILHGADTTMLHQPYIPNGHYFTRSSYWIGSL